MNYTRNRYKTAKADGGVLLSIGDYDKMNQQFSNVVDYRFGLGVDNTQVENTGFMKALAVTRGFLNYRDLLMMYLQYKEEDPNLFGFFVEHLLGYHVPVIQGKNYALATQSALDWRKFVNDMVYLHQEGLDLENNGADKYGKLHIGAKIIPWSLETNNTKITNLSMEAKWLSMKTIIEKSPDAAPDEVKRIIEERGALIPVEGMESNAQKAKNMSENRSDEIVDNQAQTGMS